MGIYRLTPMQGAPIIIQAGSLARANAIALRKFPAGVLASVASLDARALAILEAEGVPIPAVARQRVEVYRAVMRERARATARAEAAREKAREKVRAKREEEAARRAALRAQQKAERAAEKKRRVAEARRAKRQAEKEQASAQPLAPTSRQARAPILAIDHDDSRLPWE